VDEPIEPMARNVDLENGFARLSPARRKRDVGAAVLDGDRM
jgi:hypothetical protein